MCKGISVLRARIQQELYAEYLLEQRLAERGGEPELRFMYTDKVVQLPVLPMVRALTMVGPQEWQEAVCIIDRGACP